MNAFEEQNRREANSRRAARESQIAQAKQLKYWLAQGWRLGDPPKEKCSSRYLKKDSTTMPVPPFLDKFEIRCPSLDQKTHLCAYSFETKSGKQVHTVDGVPHVVVVAVKGECPPELPHDVKPVSESQPESGIDNTTRSKLAGSIYLPCSKESGSGAAESMCGDWVTCPDGTTKLSFLPVANDHSTTTNPVGSWENAPGIVFPGAKVLPDGGSGATGSSGSGSDGFGD